MTSHAQLKKRETITPSITYSCTIALQKKKKLDSMTSMYSSTQKRLFSISRDFSKLFAETLNKLNTSCFVDTSDDV